MWISLDSFCLRQSAFPISDLLLPRFDNFSAIISCNNSLCFFLFLILLGPPIMLMLVGLMLSQSSFESFSIFLILVSFYSGCMTFIYLCSDSLIHHSVSSKLLVFSSIFWFIVFFENLTVFTHFFLLCSVSFFIIFILNSVSVLLFISTSFSYFSEVLFIPSFGTCSSTSSFCLTPFYFYN